MTFLEQVDSHVVVQAARDLQPVLRDHRQEAEAKARISPAVRAAMGDAGMFRLFAPVDVGGFEAPLSIVAAALETLAAADAGAAWHALNAALAGLVAGSLDKPTRSELFADPAAHFGLSLVPAGRAMRTAGGFSLSGEWPFVTGIADATWVVAHGLVCDDDGNPLTEGRAPDNRLFLVRADQLALKDTWALAGSMRSSGSHAATAENVFVAESFAYSFRQPRQLDGAIYRVPLLLGYISTAPPVALGVLRAAIDGVVASASVKSSRMNGRAWRDLVTVQQAVSEAVAVHHCGRSGLLTALEALQARYDRPEPVENVDRVVAWATYFRVADEARRAVSSLAAAATSDVFMADHPTARAIRDVHALMVPWEVARTAQQSAGAVLLGGEPADPRF